MKISSLTKFIFIIFAASIFVLSCGNTGSKNALVILSNKVEIDAELKKIAKVFEEQSGIPVRVKTCGGEACEHSVQLKADFNSGAEPDIFVIEGFSGYEIWKDYITDLSNEPWVADTDVAFTVNGVVYGFPVAIEGWGLAYNKELLAKAGIDPATLINYGAYKAAFEKIDSMKQELGIDSVVSMTAASGMEWVTATHNINSYLANGLARDDTSIVDLALTGKLDAKRFAQYADWVQLLFEYSNPAVLTTGDYEAQVGAFVNQKSVFIHQGNWVEPNLSAAGASFDRAFAPQGSLLSDTDGIFASAPSWYVINKNGKVEEAKAFLTFLAQSPEGADYIVNKIGAVPAFKSVTLVPEAPLSASIVEWMKQEKTYAWNQYYLPDAFRVEILAPIYQQFAAKKISKAQFIDLMTQAFATLGK